MDKYLRPTTEADVEFVAPRLRQADYQECKAVTGREPLEVLLESLDICSNSLTLTTREGTPVGLCGVVTSNYGPDVGVVWMCATDAINKHQMTFLRQSQAALKYLAADYRLIFNFVDARNLVHIEWLRWMGFTFINRHENFGFEKRPFFEFVRIL